MNTTKKMIEPADMEARLASAFQPVRPSHNFVQTVRGRMVGHLTPSVVIENRLDESSRRLLLVSSVISGAILFAAIVRAIFYVINKSRM